MRFIKIEDVKDKMILAHPLYDSQGKILINSNVSLTSRMIASLKERGFRGIYIYDSISHGIEVTDNVSPRTRIETLQMLQSKSLDDYMYIARGIVSDLSKEQGIYTNLNLMNNFDNDTYIHCLNVAVYAGTFGMVYGLPSEKVELLVEAALLHDIGKSQIPLSILTKPGKLTEEERCIINNHPEYGYTILKELNSIPSVVRVSVLEHHENEDGSGYPNNYDHKKIYLFAKMIHICDVYEAMLAKRSYKNKLNPTDVIEFMMSKAGTMFNKELLELFIRNIIPYPEGMLVKLSNEESAIVKKNNKDFPTRPIVVTLKGEVINLLKHNEIVITGYDGM